MEPKDLLPYSQEPATGPYLSHMILVYICIPYFCKVYPPIHAQVS
jgi:hypothetical protein